MRIVLLIPDLENPRYKGGIQVFNRFLVRALRELGSEIRVIALSDRPQDRTMPDVSPCGRFYRLRRVNAAVKLLWWTRRMKPDLVLNGHVNFAPLCGLVSRLTGRPFATITHGVDVWTLPPKQSAALARSTAILAVSRFTRDRLLEQLDGYPAERCYLFPNTFDDARFAPGPRPEAIAQRLGISADRKVLLTVSRLAGSERFKGYDQVLRALPAVIDAVPEVVYVLAGRGEDEQRIRDLAAELGVSDRLIMAGFVPDDELPKFYQLADAFAMPSRKEGFGIVFLEAMGTGCPVVAGNKDGSVDPLMDGELGELVDPESVDEVAAAIIRLLRRDDDKPYHDPTWLRRRVVSEFGFDRYRDRLGTILSDIVAES